VNVGGGWKWRLGVLIVAAALGYAIGIGSAALNVGAPRKADSASGRDESVVRIELSRDGLRQLQGVLDRVARRVQGEGGTIW